MSTLDWYLDVEYERVVAETSDAVLFEFDDGEEHWIPRSLFTDQDEEDCTIKLVAWKAKQLGFL